jgi:hypothetical protein
MRPSLIVSQRTTKTRIGHWAICSATAVCLACGVVAQRQTAKKPSVGNTDNPQTITRPPVVESAAPNPVQPPPPAPATDASVESSPTPPLHRGVYVPANTELDVRLQHAIDSGHEHNGDMIGAVLTAPVRLSDGQQLSVGTNVGVTVVAVAAAGKLSAHGEITLQLTHVDSVGVLSDELTFFGQDGPKDLPDSEPAKGTEATVDPATTLRFHVPEIPK